MLNYIIISIISCIIGFCFGYLIKASKFKKSNGILHIDMRGEKDNYLFEVTTPFEDLHKSDEVRFRVDIKS